MITVDRTGTAGDAAGNYYAFFNGTSASCPQISGLIALMLSLDPTMTEATVQTRLRQGIRDLGANGFDNIYGWGIPDACQALRSCLTSSLLTGPSIVCSTATFSYADAVNVVTWSVTGPLTIVGSNTANPVTVSKTGNGLGTIRATIAPWCNLINAPLVFQKTITVGTPPPPINITGIQPVPNGQMDVNTNGTTYPPPYKWYVDNVLQQTINNTSTTLNSGSCSTHTLRLDATNACGTGTNSVQYTHSCSSFAIAPNPASDEISIVTDNTSSIISRKAGTQLAPVKSVQILDVNGVVLKSLKFAKAATIVKVKVAGLAPGAYIVRISSGEHVENIQFIKQ